jgi:hypothetical protein
MQEQFSASGDKAVRLGLANMQQVGATRFSALTRFRGQPTGADRSAHGLSVDWQAWGWFLRLGCAHLIPTHQVTRGNQSRKPASLEWSALEIHV